MITVFYYINFGKTINITTTRCNWTCYFFKSRNWSHNTILKCNKILLFFLTLVSFSCGSTINQNCSYFDSTGSPNAGQCAVSVCKISPDVCQVRSGWCLSGQVKLTFVKLFRNFNFIHIFSITNIKSTLNSEMIWQLFRLH